MVGLLFATGGITGAFGLMLALWGHARLLKRRYAIDCGPDLPLRVVGWLLLGIGGFLVALAVTFAAPLRSPLVWLVEIAVALIFRAHWKQLFPLPRVVHLPLQGKPLTRDTHERTEPTD